MRLSFFLAALVSMAEVLGTAARASGISLAPTPTASPNNNESIPANCKKASVCAVVTFDDQTQATFQNTECYILEKHVTAVLLHNCYCTLWANLDCTGLVAGMTPCQGPNYDFSSNPKRISCGGWVPPNA